MRGLSRRRRCRGGERVEIEPLGQHPERTVGGAGPLGAGPIPVELDPIAVGIAKIQRFAHAVVARPVKRDAGLTKAAKRLAERRAIRIPDGKMVEAGRP